MSRQESNYSQPTTMHAGHGLMLGLALISCVAAYRPETVSAVATTGKSVIASHARRHEGAASISVRLSEWKLEPSRLTVPTGDVEFTVTNGGTMLHAFEVEGQGLEKALEPIAPGATSTLRLSLVPGTYELYCPIGNGAHKKMGMIAHIEVIGAVDLDKLVAGMRQGGYVIVLRHGATNRDQSDTDPLHRDNVAAQRVLSAEGRDVSAHIGDAFRTLGLPLGQVYAGEFSRTMETAKLVSGKSAMPTLDITEGGLVVSPAENDRRSKALKAMASTRPTAGTNTLIVTHKPNILDAFGEDWFASKEGEASVFKPDGSKNLVLVARVQPADWIKIAAGH